MFDEQPSLIQEGPPASTSLWAPKPPTPLFLIHDGGGTIFAYYCLGILTPQRRVYAIANPRYHHSSSSSSSSSSSDDDDTCSPQFEGGIPQMASEYLAFIKSVFPWGGKIILGGWSLGGLISLQIAKLISSSPSSHRLEVVGIVMVDSICPIVDTDQSATRRVVQHAVQWGEKTKEETKRKVMRCFSEAVRMVGAWKLPEWKDGERIPPVVLLKAREAVPLPEGEDGRDGAVSRVDIHRGDRVLGWGGYRKDLVKRVVDVPGHHFNLFEPDGENLDVVTIEIGRACVELEGMYMDEKEAGTRYW
ncbi:Alpha/Beta hydrolase protein [Cladorrhinum sp. PSN332]|nr:Alpha/Beta hydrolase protein [Cladorrhinum sp. PSN332]